MHARLCPLLGAVLLTVGCDGAARPPAQPASSIASLSHSSTSAQAAPTATDLLGPMVEQTGKVKGPIPTQKVLTQQGKYGPPPVYNTINAVAVAPDCRSIVTLSRNGSADIWDFYRPQPKGRSPEPWIHFPGPFSIASNVYFGASDSHFFVPGAYGPVEVNATSGKVVREFWDTKPCASCWDMAIGADAKSIVTLQGTEVKLWDIATGNRVKTIQIEEGTKQRANWTHLAYSRDCKRVLVGTSHGAVEEWDLTEGKRILTLPCGPKDGRVDALLYAHDGKTAIISHVAGVRIWNLADKTARKLDETKDTGASWMALSPDGTTLAVSISNVVSLWDWKRGKILFRRVDEHLINHRLAFSPDGRYLVVTGSWNNRPSPLPHERLIEDRGILVLDLRTQRLAAVLALPGPLQSK